MSSYTIPTVVERTPRGDRATDIFSRLLGERIVFVGTPVDDGVANVIIAQLLHLAAESDDRPINLYINSPGGDHPAVMAIYDTLQYLPTEVATLCVGQAGASVALLVAAGTPGRRGILEHARVVLHQPHTGGSQGSLTDLAIEAEELARVRAEGESLLGRHTGKDPEQIRQDTDRTLVLRGAAAVEYGVADFVATSAASGGERQDRVALRPGDPDG